MAHLKIATRPQELQDIYQFRYEVYCKEMNRSQKYANHARQTIEEPLDAHSENIGMWLNDRLIGCMRLTLGQCAPGAAYERLYRIPSAQLEANNFCYVTKLMVMSSYRKTSFPIRLVKYGYDLLEDRGNAFTYIDCNDHLIPFFQKLGFRQYMDKVQHAEYGWVTPMVLYHKEPNRIGMI